MMLLLTPSPALRRTNHRKRLLSDVLVLRQFMIYEPLHPQLSLTHRTPVSSFLQDEHYCRKRLFSVVAMVQELPLTSSPGIVHLKSFRCDAQNICIVG